MFDNATEEKPYSVLKATAIWMGGTFIFLTFVGAFKWTNPIFSAGFAIPTTIVASVPFLIFDRFDNKTAARVLYGICLVGIIYFWYFK